MSRRPGIQGVENKILVRFGKLLRQRMLQSMLERRIRGPRFISLEEELNAINDNDDCNIIMESGKCNVHEDTCNFAESKEEGENSNGSLKIK